MAGAGGECPGREFVRDPVAIQDSQASQAPLVNEICSDARALPREQHDVRPQARCDRTSQPYLRDGRLLAG
jgi:hypothetical protein